MEIFKSFLQLIYPDSCLGCGQVLVKHETNICSSCISHLPFTRTESEPSTNIIARKFFGKIPSPRVYCLFNYKRGNIAQKLVYQYKYNNKRNLAYQFAEFQSIRFKEAGVQPDWDLIVPVPLHKNKLNIRGYNQSEVYAEQLSILLNIPIEPTALIRTERSKTQALLGRNNRLENVQNIYKLGNNRHLRGKSVLLVDDVITTGATMEVCTNILLGAGVTSVTLIAIASSIY